MFKLCYKYHKGKEKIRMGLSLTDLAKVVAISHEKLTHDIEYEFILPKGKSKIITWYHQEKTTDGETDGFGLHANNGASELLWKSRCMGGYYNITVTNTSDVGALIGKTHIMLNKYNKDLFLAEPTATAALRQDPKADANQDDVHDALRDDDDTRQFVPHIQYLTLDARLQAHNHGVLPTGHKIAPFTTPYLKATIYTNKSATDAILHFKVIQSFYEYALGVATPTRVIRPTGSRLSEE